MIENKSGGMAHPMWKIHVQPNRHRLKAVPPAFPALLRKTKNGKPKTVIFLLLFAILYSLFAVFLS